MAPITIQYLPTAVFCTIVLLSTIGTKLAGAANLGVSYSRDGNNLPPVEDVVQMYQKHQIGRMRIFGPDHEILEALKGSTIQLTIGVPNSEVGAMAKDANAPIRWFQGHIQPYIGHVQFRYIVVGQDDMLVNRVAAGVVLQAMSNLQSVVTSYNLQNQIKITTEVQCQVLVTNFPPSDAAFNNNSSVYMEPIIKFLSNHSSPLFLYFQPYFDPLFRHISAELTSDGSNGSEYTSGNNWVPNWIDYVLDMFYSAMGKVGVTNVRMVLGETGWPSGGGQDANVETAKLYVWSLAEHVLSKKGTPMRPGAQIEAYVFEMFNQNRRRPGEYQNFGMFYPNMESVYGIPPLQ